MNDTAIVYQPAIVAEILAAHEAAHTAARSALDHARRAGELLIEAKETIPHGAFGAWLTTHLANISERTAQSYMRVAARWPELQKRNAVADVPLRDALTLLAEPRTKPRSPATVMVDASMEIAPVPACHPDIDLRRRKLLRSRKSIDRPNRILEVTVNDARNLMAVVVDPAGSGGGRFVNTAELIAQTDPELRPIWAAELRVVVAEITLVIDALLPKGRRR